MVNVSCIAEAERSWKKLSCQESICIFGYNCDLGLLLAGSEEGDGNQGDSSSDKLLNSSDEDAELATQQMTVLLVSTPTPGEASLEDTVYRRLYSIAEVGRRR